MSMPAEAHIQIQIKREHLSSVLLKNWNERSRSMKCVQGVIIIFDMIMLQYTISSSIRRGNFSKPEGCRTRPLLFNLFNMTSRGPPNFVELHRCMGFDVGYAVNYRCVNTTSTQLNITLGSTQVHIVNHTQCAMKCACEGGPYQKCVKLKSDAESMFCYPGQEWNSDMCRCEQLKRTGPVQTMELEESVVSMKVFVFSLIGEFLVGIILMHCFHNSKPKEPRADSDDMDISVAYESSRENSVPDVKGSIILPTQQLVDVGRETSNYEEYKNHPLNNMKKISLRHTYSY